MKLIGELEAERLKEFELSVQAMEADLRQFSRPCDPTEALNKYSRSALRKDLVQAVFSQPYLLEVPEAVKVMLCDEVPGFTYQHGRKLMKRLPLSRARRRALHASARWVVNLGSGPAIESDPIKTWCQENGLEYVPIDVLEKGGRGWDLTSPNGTWSVLLWAACTGRIVTVLSSPPYRTWTYHGTAQARTPSNPWGSYEFGEPGFRENLLAVQDMFLWSLASVSKGCATPFLKELPSNGH